MQQIYLQFCLDLYIYILIIQLWHSTNVDVRLSYIVLEPRFCECCYPCFLYTLLNTSTLPIYLKFDRRVKRQIWKIRSDKNLIKNTTHRFLWLYIDLICSDDSILLCVQGRVPLNQNCARVHRSGTHIPWFSRYYTKFQIISHHFIFKKISSWSMTEMPNP